jgi:hypothetical protein
MPRADAERSGLSTVLIDKIINCSPSVLLLKGVQAAPAALCPTNRQPRSSAEIPNSAGRRMFARIIDSWFVPFCSWFGCTTDTASLDSNFGHRRGDQG